MSSQAVRPDLAAATGQGISEPLASFRWSGNRPSLNPPRASSTPGQHRWAFLGAVGDDEPRCRQSPHKMVKLRFDGSEISEDICVIELQVVRDHGPRAVRMNLDRLSQKAVSYLSALDDEEGCTPAVPRRRNSSARRQ